MSRFSLLPEELNRKIFELAIRSHFMDEIADKLWYMAWINLRKKFNSNKNVNQIHCFIDYILHNSDAPIVEEKNKIYPNDVNIVFINSNYGLFVCYNRVTDDVNGCYYIMTDVQYSTLNYCDFYENIINIRSMGEFVLVEVYH